MKLLKKFFTLIIIYTLCGIPYSFADSITPAINEVKLAQGQRTLASVTFENKESKDTEILLSVYEYDPKTDEIFKDSKNIFLKTDTDTFLVKSNSKKEIPYEIYPLQNLELGTYFNILVLTEAQDTQDIYINKGISQLVVLHITDPDQDVKGIATTDYTAEIKVVNKGIPFLKPLEIKYTVYNNSKYVITPAGRIDIFNKTGAYKPEYIYINKEDKRLYPGEKIEKSITVNNWHISDIFSERVASGSFYNGLDSNPKSVQIQINSYIYEILGVLTVILVTVLLLKSLKEDRKSKKAS